MSLKSGIILESVSYCSCIFILGTNDFLEFLSLDS